MPGPWEDYAPTATQTVGGPWEDYGKKPWEDYAPKKKTLEQIKASVGPSSESEVSLATKIGSALEPWVASIAPQNLWNQVERGASAVGNALAWPAYKLAGIPTEQRKPFVIDTQNNALSQPAGTESTLPYKPGVPTLPAPLKDADVNPISEVINNFIQGASTPGGIATLPAFAAGGASSKVAQALLATQMIPGAAEQAQVALSPEATPHERAVAGMQALLSGLFGLGATKGVLEKPSALTVGKPVPDVSYPLPRIEDLATQEQPVSAASALLPQFAGGPYPAENTKLVNAGGGVMDLTQLSPVERAALDQRTRQVYRLRGEEVGPRPAQAETPIIGQQPQQSLIRQVQLEQGGEVRPVSQATRAPVEPSGGEVSFRAPAAAEAIPNAQQVALPNTPKLYAGEAMIFDPEFWRQTAAGVKDIAKWSGEMLAKHGPGIAEALKKGVALQQQDRELTKEPYASPIRSNQENLSKEGLQPTGGREPRSENLQQHAEEGKPPSDTLQRQEGQGGEDVTKLYSLPGMMFDPDFYKSTAKKAKAAGEFLKDKLGAATEHVVPLLKFDTKSVLPDLGEKSAANAAFSQPYSTEKVPVLGPMLGGKARVETPQDMAVAAWHGEYHGVAPAMASMTGETIRGKINKVFVADETGDLNVKPTQAGQSLKISDVFEELQRDRNAYRLTPAQRTAFDTVIVPVVTRMKELAKKYGITKDELEGYFTRIVTSSPNEAQTVGGQGKPLSRLGIQRERTFATEQQGWQRGYKYSTDSEARLVAGVEQLYKAMANKRLASDPVLKAQTPKQKIAELRESYAEQLKSGEMAKEQFEHISDRVLASGSVNQPMLAQKIFPPEVANMLRKEFGDESNVLRKGIVLGNNMLKATTFGFDWGAGQIQGMLLITKHPLIWAEAQFTAIKNMTHPMFFAKFAREHIETLREMAQLGSGVGRLQEYAQGLGKGEPLVEWPKKAGEAIGKFVGGEIGGKVGKYTIGAPGYAVEAFGRQFQALLDVSKVLLWETMRDKVPTSAWPKMIQAVENMVLSSRMEANMVSKGRALIERALTLAPSYYRAALMNFVAAINEKGPVRRESAKALAQFALGQTIIFVAGAKLLGVADDEIKKRLSPANSEFMTWPIKHADGSVVNFGFGGFHKAVLRLIGKSYVTTKEHPENWLSATSEKNPLAAFLRGHAAPIPSLIWEGITGKDFLGRSSDIRELGGRTIPLATQQLLTKEGEAPAKPLEVAASLAGMTAFPESFTKRRGREVSTAAQAKYGKDYENLTVLQRAKVNDMAERKLQGVPTGMSVERSREIAQRKEDERRDKLIATLPVEMRNWAKENKVKFPGYQSTVSTGGVNVQLTDKERELLHEEMLKEYSKATAAVMHGHFVTTHKDPKDVQEYLNDRIALAHAKAWSTVEKEIQRRAKLGKEGQK